MFTEACEVLEVKVAGYEVLGGLLEEFILLLLIRIHQKLSRSSYQLQQSDEQSDTYREF